MPLAPMGCEVQVHEKTDKRGTWTYHSVDEWYLNTSPEHYRVHNCYIKATKNTRLSDTVQFQHKSITNPELTPADKLMQAIANCKAALKGLTNHKTDQQIQELKKLVEQAEHKVQQSTQVSRVPEPSQQTPVPRVQEQSQQHLPSTQLPRVHATPTGTVQLPTITHRVTRAAAQKAKARRRHNQHQEPVNFPNQPPAHSTRSKTKKAAPTAIPTFVASNSTKPSQPRRSARASKLKQPTTKSRRDLHQALSAQLQSPKGRKEFIKQYKRLERETQQALAVLDEETGKLLKYKQLMTHPKYKRKWQVSAADEFR
eukprot:scaffold4513_cov37-Cyclotella_meneghiniana.AAC.2